MNINNWVAEYKGVTEKDTNTLKMAKNRENVKIKNGWKYIKARNSLEILVPCDRRGRPTVDGIRMIESITKEKYNGRTE